MEQTSTTVQSTMEGLVRFNAPMPQKFSMEIPNNENIIASIQGKFSEWLVCTDKQVHIIKSGFSTGRMRQTGNFAIAYKNIANAIVEFHMSYGYFEIIVAGQPHTKKTYWGNQEQNPQYAPNSIGIAKKDVEKFEAACAYINAKSVEEKEAYAVPTASSEGAIAQSVPATVPAATEFRPAIHVQESHSVRCPKCGSADLQIYNEVVGKGVSGTKVCLFGICGLCGAGKTKNVQYWICKNCGYKFKA